MMDVVEDHDQFAGVEQPVDDRVDDGCVDSESGKRLRRSESFNSRCYFLKSGQQMHEETTPVRISLADFDPDDPHFRMGVDPLGE